MLDLGAEPLPESLLIEIGLFATTWAAIEQMVLVETIELYNFRHRYRHFEEFKASFSQLLKLWQGISRQARPPEFHDGIAQLCERMRSAASVRADILHGVWEDKRGNIWGLYGGKGFCSFRWVQKKGAPYHRAELQINLHEISDQRIKLQALRRDLHDFVNQAHFKQDLNDTFFVKR